MNHKPTVPKWMPIMYVTYFGIIKTLANEHGYALCVHGSVVRDFDLICVPFDIEVKSHEELLTAIREKIGNDKSSGEIYDKIGHEPHGRTCYTIECGAGGYLDISFTPSLQQAIQKIKDDLKRDFQIREMFQRIDTTPPFA